MKVIDVCFKQLLVEITKKFSVPEPKYRLTVDTSGQLSAYADVEIQRGDSVIETIRSYGASAHVAGTSEQDAAHNCIITLRDDLGFTVKDVNFEDLKFYKNLYSHLSEQYNTLMLKYNSLKCDYKVLKECYNKSLDERDCYFTERSENQQNLEKVFDLINQPDMVVDTLEKGVAQEVSTASE